MMEESLEELVRRAREGDGESLERLVSGIQDRVYGLALRMLWHPEDARDASQEILIRIVTRLATFRGESSFSTWAHRVAANYLLSARKSRLEQQAYTFQRFGEELDEGLSDAPAVPATGSGSGVWTRSISSLPRTPMTHGASPRCWPRSAVWRMSGGRPPSSGPTRSSRRRPTSPPKSVS